MKRAIASALLLFCSSSLSSAAFFTDFEDLSDDTVVYPVGPTIESKGLSFVVIAFPNTGGAFVSGIFDYMGPLQTKLIGTGRAALDFVLPLNTNFISFDYGIGDVGAGMIINGVATPLGDSFDPLDGTVVGGVLISINPPPSAPFEDHLTLSGEIASFVIGGIELSIDNVAVFVPEPSSAALLMLVIGTLACRRP